MTVFFTAVLASLTLALIAGVYLERFPISMHRTLRRRSSFDIRLA